MKKQYDQGIALGTGKSTTLHNDKKVITSLLYGKSVMGHSYYVPPLKIYIPTHEEVAAKLFNIPIDEVTPAQHQYAKRMRYWEMYSTPINATKENIFNALNIISGE